MIDEELLHPDTMMAIRVIKKDWKRLKDLAKKMGRPYSANLLTRLFVREGLERKEKELKGKKK